MWKTAVFFDVTRRFRVMKKGDAEEHVQHIERCARQHRVSPFVFLMDTYDNEYGVTYHHTLLSYIACNLATMPSDLLPHMNEYIYFVLLLADRGYIHYEAKDYFDDGILSDFREYRMRGNYHKRIECIIKQRGRTVRIIQGAFRKFLALKKLHRRRLHECLTTIVYSPPGQVGLVLFPEFRGGVEYTRCHDHYFSSLPKQEEPSGMMVIT